MHKHFQPRIHGNGWIAGEKCNFISKFIQSSFYTKAVAKGLKVPSYIKTTLSPGSKVVTKYLEATGLDKSMKQLGFETAGYGCMTCIGNRLVE